MGAYDEHLALHPRPGLRRDRGGRGGVRPGGAGLARVDRRAWLRQRRHGPTPHRRWPQGPRHRPVGSVDCARPWSGAAGQMPAKIDGSAARVLPSSRCAPAANLSSIWPRLASCPRGRSRNWTTGRDWAVLVETHEEGDLLTRPHHELPRTRRGLPAQRGRPPPAPVPAGRNPRAAVRRGLPCGTRRRYGEASPGRGATCTWLASRISATGVSESQDLAALGRDAGRVVRSTGIISAMASEAANELLRSGREALAAAD